MNKRCWFSHLDNLRSFIFLATLEYFLVSLQSVLGLPIRSKFCLVCLQFCLFFSQDCLRLDLFRAKNGRHNHNHKIRVTTILLITLFAPPPPLFYTHTYISQAGVYLSVSKKCGMELQIKLS